MKTITTKEAADYAAYRTVQFLEWISGVTPSRYAALDKNMQSAIPVEVRHEAIRVLKDFHPPKPGE